MPDFYTDNLAQASAGLGGTFDSSVWWLVFWGLLTFFLVYSVILLYHWFTFSMKRRSAIAASVIYLGVSAFLIFTMLAGIVGLSVV